MSRIQCITTLNVLATTYNWKQCYSVVFMANIPVSVPMKGYTERKNVLHLKTDIFRTGSLPV
jgi:hypothetical protein